MDDEYKYTVLFLGVQILIIALIVFVALWVDSSSCSARAHGLQFNHQWGPIKGCLLETSPSHFTPIENYRVF